jgi:outer membrane biosynthesis protein TonB
MVRIRAVISREGVPTHFKVVQGPRELISAALEALQKWRYRPCIIGGKAVEVKATFDVILPKKLSRAKGR